MKIIWRGKTYSILETVSTRASLANPSRFLINWFGGSESAAGVRVNTFTALDFPPFHAGVRAIAETLGQLSMILYERDGDSRTRATRHPLFDLLHLEPNPLMSPISFYETAVAHMIINGNFFAEIEYNRVGEPIALWPLPPHRTKAVRRGRVLEFEYTRGDGQQVTLQQFQVLHIPGLGYDGIQGYSIVELHRDAIGLGIAADQYAARLMANGAMPTGVLQFDGVFEDDNARREFRERWEQDHRGSDNAGRVAVLEMGMKWQSMAMTNTDAQFLETRKDLRTLTATMLRIPPHIIGDLEHATFSNIEHQAIEFVMYSILPWARRIEQAINRTLIRPRERGTFFAEFLIDTLLRGDQASRYQAYAIGRNGGWLSPNDIRRLENMNPIPAEDGGDTYVIPLNMAPASQVLQEASNEGSDEPDVSDLMDFLNPQRATILFENASPSALPEARATSDRVLRIRRRIQRAHRGMFQRAAASFVEREIRELETLIADARLTGDDIEEIYRDLRDFAEDSFRSVCDAYSRSMFEAATAEIDGSAEPDGELERFCADYTRSMAHRISSSGSGQIRQIALDSPREQVESDTRTRLDEWREKRARKLANREIVQAGAAFAKFAFRSNGVRRLVWRTLGANCPLCNQLDGKVVGIDENFVTAGDQVDPDDGKTTPLVARNNVGHPQLHGGCDCMIAAE